MRTNPNPSTPRFKDTWSKFRKSRALPADQHFVAEEMQQSAQLTFSEHLQDLRKALIRSMYGLGLAFIIALCLGEQIISALVQPIIPQLPEGARYLVFNSPLETMSAYLEVSFWSALLIAAPWLFYNIWTFVAPGLNSKERKLILPFVLSASFFFLLGCAFCYAVVFPLGFKFFIEFGGFEFVKPMLTLSAYLDFVLKTMVLFGVLFEMPNLMVFLSWIGLVKASFLRQYRSYAIVIMSVVAAVLTPPDPVSMMLMLVPLVLLYEISIWAVALLGRRPVK